MSRIAFYTFGLMRAPFGDPEVKEFEDRADPTFGHAGECEGFLMLYYGWEAIPRFADPAINTAAQTLSLWRNLESVYTFAYSGLHAQSLRQRREWFVKGDWPTYVAWWVADDHEPTYHEAIEQFEYLHDHGPTPSVFNFRSPFDEHGQPTTLDRPPQNVGAE